MNFSNRVAKPSTRFSSTEKGTTNLTEEDGRHKTNNGRNVESRVNSIHADNSDERTPLLYTPTKEDRKAEKRKGNLAQGGGSNKTNNGRKVEGRGNFFNLRNFLKKFKNRVRRIDKADGDERRPLLYKDRDDEKGEKNLSEGSGGNKNNDERRVRVTIDCFSFRGKTQGSSLPERSRDVHESQNISMNKADADKRTPLRMGHSESVKIVLENPSVWPGFSLVTEREGNLAEGGGSNKTNNDKGVRKPIASNCHTEIVKILQEKNTKVDQYDNKNRTPLWQAEYVIKREGFQDDKVSGKIATKPKSNQPRIETDEAGCRLLVLPHLRTGVLQGSITGHLPIGVLRQDR